MLLTHQQNIVIDNYLMGKTKRDSMRIAGYSDSVVTTQEERFFNNPRVIKEINKRRKKIMQRNALTEDWIIQRLMNIADAAIGDMLEVDDYGTPFLNYDKMTPELRKALIGINVDEYMEGRGAKAQNKRKVKIQQSDPLRALEMLGKYLGLFKDKVEVSGDADLIAKLQAGRNRIASE